MPEDSTVIIGASSLDDVVKAVWEANKTPHGDTPGSMGEWVAKKILTFKQWIGLK